MRKVLKKVMCVMLAATLAVGATGCGKTSDSKKDEVTVAIVQPMSHSSLDQIRDTIVKKLKDSGKNIKIVTDNANGDSAANNTILENDKAKGVDIIVPIATSTAQSAKSVYEGTTTPIVFAAVSDPVAAGLTGNDCENITGVSNNIPADEIVKLIYNFQPDCKKIGFVYTSSETNSVSTITAAKKYCDDNQIVYEEVSIANVSELQTAVETLLSKGVDALYTGNDNTIASAMATYTDAAYSKNVPIYCGADSMVADGGFATVGVNYVQLGEQVADLVLQIADGKKPADLPYETISEYAKYVNMQAVKQFGGQFDEKAFDGFEVLVEENGVSHFNEK
ncbi:MAG: ABC transporter substrate-binding protein [Lachnospiraceae bacterium]|nr:ABC transporter substrate-binding protein [Lachnospiraceae bacterium]